MSACCIDNCNNRSEKGFRLFGVPSAQKRRDEWMVLIGKNTLPKWAAVCEVHFDENQFEQHRQDGRKLLRPFATPNLLLKRIVATNTIHTSKHEILDWYR
ncbi:THAP domain-containing protein 4-like [Harpegnathos saltator]|uniref:THAP domain-containing protein 4-like n=1 Tax=Harpegnathos saltator TaxID=610380 RepID=UPI000948A7ED|nr:THAP domain-containing protein 4-like [Harpegnathos saltator]